MKQIVVQRAKGGPKKWILTVESPILFHYRGIVLYSPLLYTHECLTLLRRALPSREYIKSRSIWTIKDQFYLKLVAKEILKLWG